jgi:hypothetical protein
MTIEAMLTVGAVIGFIIGLGAPRERTGCLALLIIPVSALLYTLIWQAQHPENLRSTSALDLIFAPLWPSIGAIAGYVFGRLVRPRKSAGEPSES